MYITRGLKALGWTSDINKTTVQLGYYDENDEICKKYNVIKLIHASEIKGGQTYYTTFDTTITLPSSLASDSNNYIDLDTTAIDNVVQYNNTTLTGVVIDPTKPNIKRYTVA